MNVTKLHERQMVKEREIQRLFNEQRSSIGKERKWYTTCLIFGTLPSSFAREV